MTEPQSSTARLQPEHSQKQPLSFSSLPTELRLAILSLVLFDISPIPHQFPDEDGTIYQYLEDPPITSSPLLLTSRQICQDTLSILDQVRAQKSVTYFLDVLIKNEEHIYPTWTNVPLLTQHLDRLHVDLRLYEDLPRADAKKQQYWANLLWNERLVFGMPDLMFDTYLMALNRVLTYGPSVRSPSPRREIWIEELVVNFVYDEDKLKDNWATRQVPLLPQHTASSDDASMQKLIHWSTIVDELEVAIHSGHWPSPTFSGPARKKIGRIVVTVNDEEKRHYNIRGAP